jgi:hypothetical protein
VGRSWRFHASYNKKAYQTSIYVFAFDGGDSKMDALEILRRAIACVFDSWERLPSAISKFRITGVLDTAHDRYTLTHVDFDGERYRSHLLAQLEIRGDKIWILTDNTEDGIATELVSAGIPKDKIVLGYFSPRMRELGDFAVA